MMAMSDIKYYLAVDIGASSGRHILAHLEEGKIVCEEVYRFWNGNDLLIPDGNGGMRSAGPADGQEMPEGSHRVWNVDRLFAEVVSGMKKCAEIGKVPVSLSIDTWAVDYVLLDANDQPAAPCYAYRDGRTAGMDEAVYQIIPQDALYARTGIQKAIFNTIYQLMAAKVQEPETLERSQSLLMVPDYLGWLLTGVKVQEYTNASTTQLVNPATKEWDYELIDLLGFPKRLFGEISMPGTVVGDLRPEIQEQVGFNCRLILAATHDTGSAVMSVPSDSDEVLYISSGTWSLLGCERREADCSEAAQAANFTNEGGYDYRFRFLKNIMGLWMIQSVKKEFDAAAEAESAAAGELGDSADDGAGKKVIGGLTPELVLDADHDYSFGHLCDRAAEEKIGSLVDANADRFLAPQSMVREVQAACRETGQHVPKTPWEISRVIYRSLAECYRKAVIELEAMTGVQYDSINIVGGGANARWLNELTAQVTGRTVLAGPGEATAIGCLGAQMIADGTFCDLKAFRRCVRDSFDVKEYRAQE